MALRARDIMQPHIVAVPPNMPLSELADLLISRRITGAPVLEAGVLVGVVSRSDFVRCLSLDRSLAGLIAEGLEQDEFAPAELAPKPTRSVSPAEIAGRFVRDIMVTEPLTVTPDTPITEVAALLVSQHRHRIVVTEGRTVRGIISTMDLVRLIAEERVREP